MNASMNNSQTNNEYIAKTRKFHDAWAFILYLLLTSVTFISIILMKPDISLLMPRGDVFYHSIACFCVVIGFIILNFFAYSVFPEIYIKFTMCLYPLISIALIIYFRSLIFVISTVISLIQFAIFVYMFWSRLKDISTILKASVRILIKNTFSVILGIISLTIAIICNSLMFNFVEYYNTTQKIVFYPLIILNLFWSLFNALYFFRVYITSIVAYHIINPDIGVLFDSLTNTFYSLGSISFGGLIIAFVSTARYFIENARNNRHDHERRSIVVEIIAIIMAILLCVLEDIVNFVNEFTMPYIAIHGESYTNSMRNSVEIVFRTTSPIFSGLYALNCSMFYNFQLVPLICLGLMYFQKATHLIGWLRLIFFTIPPLVFFACTMMTISSSYLAVIYLHNDNPSLIKNGLPGVSEAIKNLKY